MENTPQTQKLKTGPKDFFLYLGITITLYVSVVSLLRLLFEIIDRVFQDQLFFSSYTGGIRAAIASLIVIFPLYLILSHIAQKDVVQNPDKRGLWVRRWLSYLTIFLAGIAVVIDLIVIINSFLGGEITSRFVYKALSVFVISGSVFWYYLRDIRGVISKTHCTVMTWLSVVFVLAVIVGGFFVMGSPFAQRDMKFDDTRVRDLQNIQSEVVFYWQNKRNLPSELALLEDDITGFIVPTDPETDDGYEYQVARPLSFELCAVFAFDNMDTGEPVLQRQKFGSLSQDNFRHEAGRFCFERTIDPDFVQERFPQLIR